MEPIYHLVRRADWGRALAAGEYRPASLDAEGFVHFSFADQVTGSANRHYPDVDDLVVVEFDATSLTVVVEDSYGSGTAYPHVYGPIPTAHAVRAHPLTRDANGAHTFSPGPASAAASPDR